MKLEGTIVFSSGKHGDYDIFTLNLVTQEVRQLTEGDGWNKCPQWSPDGKTIVYISNQTGTPEIWLMNEDGTNERRLTAQNKWHNSPAWSPDGQALVFCANYHNDINIYTMKLNGHDLKQITRNPEMDYTPQFSPDGRYIIYTSKRSGNPDIWCYECLTGRNEQFTHEGGRDYAPTFSPDGKRIAFVSGLIGQDGKENLEIYIMDADGKNKERMTVNLGDDRHVSWSPDSRYLIYTTGGPGASIERLQILEVSTRKAQELKFDRSLLELEIKADPRGYLLFKFLPESLRRKMYPEIYFGTEQYPHWKQG